MLLAATTTSESETRSNGNEGVLHIPQSSSITGHLPSYCLMSYLGHSLGVVLPLCRDAIAVFYSTDRLDRKLFLFYRTMSQKKKKKIKNNS